MWVGMDTSTQSIQVRGREPPRRRFRTVEDTRLLLVPFAAFCYTILLIREAGGLSVYRLAVTFVQSTDTRPISISLIVRSPCFASRYAITLGCAAEFANVQLEQRMGLSKSDLAVGSDGSGLDSDA
jgi:hypothetical protein